MDETKNLPKDWFERKKIAADPTISQDTLAVLAKYPVSDVREEVAKNHHTSRKTLDELAKDQFWFVRREVAKNPHTHREVSKNLRIDKQNE